MRRSSVAFVLGVVAVFAAAIRVAAAPVTFSGTVSYTGTYVAGVVYVAVVDTLGPTTIGFVGLAAGAPPFSMPYAVDFDNAGLVRPMMVAALLDVDGSGFDPDSLDTTLGEPDILGWYAGQSLPLHVAVGASHANLDFALPRGEIRGDVTFDSGQTYAEIMAPTFPDYWSTKMDELTASGPYAIIGLYAGDYVVAGWDGMFRSICYGDPSCTNPTVLSLAVGQVMNGVDLDFRPTALGTRSWGRVKALHR
jgi:hypothetical protein